MPLTKKEKREIRRHKKLRALMAELGIDEDDIELESDDDVEVDKEEEQAKDIDESILNDFVTVDKDDVSDDGEFEVQEVEDKDLEEAKGQDFDLEALLNDDDDKQENAQEEYVEELQNVIKEVAKCLETEENEEEELSLAEQELRLEKARVELEKEKVRLEKYRIRQEAKLFRQIEKDKRKETARLQNERFLMEQRAAQMNAKQSGAQPDIEGGFANAIDEIISDEQMSTGGHFVTDSGIRAVKKDLVDKKISQKKKGKRGTLIVKRSASAYTQRVEGSENTDYNN